MASPIGSYYNKLPSPIGSYGGTSGANERVAAPYWARKMGRFLKTLFDPDTGTPQNPTLHPVPEIGDNLVITGITDTTTITYMANAWRVHQNRKSIYQDIERMDSEDEIVATALDIIADCSVSYSELAASQRHFKIRAKTDRIQAVLDAMSKRLNLPNEIWYICRDMVKHGNEFREVVVDRQAMQVVAFKQTISYQIYPKTNARGDKCPGWTLKTDGDVFTGKEYDLEEWQIVPFIFGTKRGYLSIPPLAPARRNWIRLAKMEDGMAIARLIRAYDKMVHKIPVKPEMSSGEIMARIRMHKDAVTKRRILDSSGLVTQVDAPLDVQTDFYLPDDGTNRGGIELLSANNAQLGNLNDIIYHREKLLSRLQVPIAYLQITTAQKTHISASASKKADVEIQFARMLRRVQRNLLEGLRRLCDIELMLNGITPSDDAYEIELTQINTKDLREDAEIELTYAQAAVYFVEAFGSLPPELLADKFMHLNSDQQEMLQKFLEKYGDRVVKARVKTIETNAQPKTSPLGTAPKDRIPGDNSSGTGNQNKGRAQRTTEQRGAVKPTQSDETVPIDALVDLFYTITEEVHQDFREQGVNVPELDDSYRNAIRANLEAIADRKVSLE
jgi:hypothetical protein